MICFVFNVLKDCKIPLQEPEGLFDTYMIVINTHDYE